MSNNGTIMHYLLNSVLLPSKEYDFITYRLISWLVAIRQNFDMADNVVNRIKRLLVVLGRIALGWWIIFNLVFDVVHFRHRDRLE